MKNLRIYLATQIDCKPCEITKEVLGKEIEGVPVYEVDLGLNPKRAKQMGVTATPTIFIVEGNDDNANGIWEESEEQHVWHQTGMIIDAENIKAYVKALKEGKKLYTTL